MVEGGGGGYLDGTTTINVGEKYTVVEAVAPLF